MAEKAELLPAELALGTFDVKLPTTEDLKHLHNVEKMLLVSALESHPCTPARTVPAEPTLLAPPIKRREVVSQRAVGRGRARTSDLLESPALQ